MKVPNGCEMKVKKDVRGRRILGYELTQGAHCWIGKTEAEAIAAREADIAKIFADSMAPIVLPTPHKEDIGGIMIGYPDAGGWWYGFARPHTSADGKPLMYYHHSVSARGIYATRRECDREMRTHAARIAIEIGPAPECAIVCDGYAYLRSEAVRVEDIVRHNIQIAKDHARKIAESCSMKFGFPRADGEEFVSYAEQAESCRQHEIVSKQDRVYTYTNQWIDLLRPVAFPEPRSVPQ